MIGLKDILYGIPVHQLIGEMDHDIQKVAFDSREVEAATLFVAISGTQVNGHSYVDTAIERGAVAILCEKIPESIQEGITYILVDDTALALGVCASNFYGNPSAKLKLVGVTGTNGKTTVATLLYQLFTELGYAAGLLSTVENRIAKKVVQATHTTPDPVQINFLLNEMVEQGCDYCFMEVSSHAIIQQRIAGLQFVGGVFTNITHDHLDFHETFDKYIKAKQIFFDGLDRFAFALYNQDDKNGKIMVQNTFAYRKSYGIKSIADFKAKVMETHFEGTLLQIDDHELWVKLLGLFNAYNMLAVYGTAILLEQETIKVLTAMSRISGAEGRFETIISDKGVVGIVDYAHTPDALKNILEAIQKLRKPEQQLITVVGCGGDRDRAKRPEMARVALQESDRVILTSDNPRTEDPQAIIRDMEAGIPDSERKKCFAITDRKEAIRAACHLAQKEDIILIAGKGHEKYQEINKERFPFDDKEILTQAFEEQQ